MMHHGNMIVFICRRGSYVDIYNRSKTTVWNDKQLWKQSKQTTEAIKSESQ
jgi:hypothetical protein